MYQLNIKYHSGELCISGIYSALTDAEQVATSYSSSLYSYEILDVGVAPLWATLRSQRNSLLSSSDWTQLADSPMSPTKKTAWATYRQSLRDLPANTTDPSNPTWPTAPAPGDN